MQSAAYLHYETCLSQLVRNERQILSLQSLKPPQAPTPASHAGTSPNKDWHIPNSSFLNMIWSTIVTPLAGVDCTTLKRDAWWTPNKWVWWEKSPAFVQVPPQALRTQPQRLRSSIRFCLKVDLDWHDLCLQRSRGREPG
jgi:hypothetical protein